MNTKTKKLNISFIRIYFYNLSQEFQLENNIDRATD